MKKILLISLLLLQTACTSYQYIEPADPEGKACTRSCLDKDWSCSSDCNRNYTTCLSATNIEINLGSISAQNNNRQSVCNSAKYSCEYQCKRYYNRCYESCGGMIIEKTN